MGSILKRGLVVCTLFLVPLMMAPYGGKEGHGGGGVGSGVVVPAPNTLVLRDANSDAFSAHLIAPALPATPATPAAGWASFWLDNVTGIYKSIHTTLGSREFLTSNPLGAPPLPGQVLMMATGGVVEGSSWTNTHGALAGLAADTHTQYGKFGAADLGNVTPNGTLPCSTADIGRRFVTTQSGALIWKCSAVDTWVTVNETVLRTFVMNVPTTSADPGCVTDAGAFINNCTNGQIGRTIGVPGIITRVVVANNDITDPGATCTLHLVKNPCVGVNACLTNDGDPTDLTGANGTVAGTVAVDPALAQNLVPTVTQLAVWDGTQANFTLTATDSWALDADATCDTLSTNFDGTIVVFWVKQ